MAAIESLLSVYVREGTRYELNFNKKGAFWGCDLWTRKNGEAQYVGVIAGRNTSLEMVMSDAAKFMKEALGFT